MMATTTYFLDYPCAAGGSKAHPSSNCIQLESAEEDPDLSEAQKLWIEVTQQ